MCIAGPNPEQSGHILDKLQKVAPVLHGDTAAGIQHEHQVHIMAGVWHRKKAEAY